MDDERSNLEKIVSMSNNLVPPEETAMECVKNGDLTTAQTSVFSEEYGETVKQINRATDETIQNLRYSAACIYFSRPGLSVCIFQHSEPGPWYMALAS